MTAPTREEVARGLIVANSGGAWQGTTRSESMREALVMADYVLGLIRDEREANAKVCADRALLSHDHANALEVGGNSKAAEAAFRERDEAEACAAAIRSRGAS